MTPSPASACILLALLCAALATPSAVPTQPSLAVTQPEPDTIVTGGDEAFAINPISETTSVVPAEETIATAELAGNEKADHPRSWRFRAGGGIESDDNIFLDSENKQSDVIYSLTAGFSFFRELKGKSRIAFDYDATAYFFQDFEDGDGVDHLAVLSASWMTERTKFDLDLHYQHATGSQREVGQFVDRDLIGAKLGFSHDLTAKTTLDGSLAYDSSLYDDDLNSSQDYAARLGLSYRITAKSTLGLAGVGGILSPEGSSDQTYQQFLFTAWTATTAKLTFSGDVGIEFRQTDGEDAAGDEEDLVFGFQGRYEPRPRTAFLLSGHRSTEGSAVEDNAVINLTSISLGVEQKIGDRLSANLTGGYEISDYDETRDAASIDRREEYWFLRTGLTYKPTTATWISAFYDYRNNDSSEDGISFENNRFGLNMGVSF